MNPIDPNFNSATIIHGDLLHILPHFPDGLFGGIITDPPYASGAADQNARQKSTAAKYSGMKGKNPFPDFEGDAKDQRSWTHWMAEWLTEPYDTGAVLELAQCYPFCISHQWDIQ